MTLRLVTLVEDNNGAVAKAIVSENAQDYAALQLIFRRAGNTWPDAPPQCKRIIDLVVSGSVLQEYGPDVPSIDPERPYA